MAPPAGYTDYYVLELQINYNDSAMRYLQSPTGATYQPPQETQAGWNESYGLFLSAPPNGTNLPLQNAYTLVQARAALLGLNFYIKKAICHQASVFKSSWPMPGSASKPLFDSLAAYPLTNSNQYCSSPEETVMLRLEASNLYRTEHQIRGIKDYMSDDTMTYFPATGYADAATFATSQVFDTLQQTIPPPGLTGASPATVSFTLGTGNYVSGVTLLTAGSYPGVPNGTYPTYLPSTVGSTTVALGSVTINANVATAVAVSATLAGSGYQGTAGTIPVSNDPYGLPNWQAPSVYWANFMSCLISFTQSGTIRRIAQGTFSAPVPSFPSGLAPAYLNSPVKCNRCMFQRVGNRQTGQIRLTKRARVKRGI